MDTRIGRGGGWLTFAAVVLLLSGIFNAIDGLMAVYRSNFFVNGAVFVFSDLNTWGWIIFGLGIATFLAGLGVSTGNQAARWFGIFIAGVGAIAQMMFAQAYPFWTGLIIAVDVAVIYGLAAYGGRENVAALSGTSYETTTQTPTEATPPSEERRAA
jgi:hypothetical protein